MRKFFVAIGTWLSSVAAVDQLWPKFGIQDPSVFGAVMTVTTVAILYLGFVYCTTKHAILQARIEECAAAKKRLEEQILKKRLSSQR